MRTCNALHYMCSSCIISMGGVSDIAIERITQHKAAMSCMPQQHSRMPHLATRLFAAHASSCERTQTTAGVTTGCRNEQDASQAPGISSSCSRSFISVSVLTVLGPDCPCLVLLASLDSGIVPGADWGIEGFEFCRIALCRENYLRVGSPDSPAHFLS